MVSLVQQDQVLCGNTDDTSNYNAGQLRHNLVVKAELLPRLTTTTIAATCHHRPPRP